MATITWPATMRLHKKDELEEKLILSFSCAASIVEQYHNVSVNHIKHITVRCFEKNCVEVTYVVPDNDHEDVSMVRAQFEYMPETGHWTMMRANELYQMYQQITKCLVADPKEEDGYFDIVYSVLVRYELKTSVEIEKKYWEAQ